MAGSPPALSAGGRTCGKVTHLVSYPRRFGKRRPSAPSDMRMSPNAARLRFHVRRCVWTLVFPTWELSHTLEGPEVGAEGGGRENPAPSDHWLLPGFRLPLWILTGFPWGPRDLGPHTRGKLAHSLRPQERVKARGGARPSSSRIHRVRPVCLSGLQRATC